MTQEIKIPLAWGELAAVASGPETGKRFLFLHGWLDNAAGFAPLIAEFPKDWRCVALDLAGHGHSDHRPPGATYHFMDAVFDVLDVVDALGWDRFYLVGHSLGAGIASIVASLVPSRLRALLLIEGLGPLSASPEETAERSAELYQARKDRLHKKLPVYPNLEPAIRARIQAGAMSKDGARLLIERGMRTVDGGFTWRSDPRLRLPTQRFTEGQVGAYLRRITAPTYCLVTDDGLMVKYGGWKERGALLPDFTWEQVPGGHHPHLDQPRPVATRVESFLAAPNRASY